MLAAGGPLASCDGRSDGHWEDHVQATAHSAWTGTLDRLPVGGGGDRLVWTRD